MVEVRTPVYELPRRLVTTIVECNANGTYRPLAIKWYDGTIYPIMVTGYYPAEDTAFSKHPELWFVNLGRHKRVLILENGNWYVVHDPGDDTVEDAAYKPWKVGPSKPKPLV